MTSVEKYRNKLNLKFNYDQLKLNLVFYILLLNPVLNYDLETKKIGCKQLKTQEEKNYHIRYSRNQSFKYQRFTLTGCKDMKKNIRV